MKPAPTGVAADWRARLADKGVKLPVKADVESPGWILGSDGRRVAGIAWKTLDIEAMDALRLAEAFAAAINWYGGLERPT